MKKILFILAVLFSSMAAFAQSNNNPPLTFDLWHTRKTYDDGQEVKFFCKYARVTKTDFSATATLAVMVQPEMEFRIIFDGTTGPDYFDLVFDDYLTGQRFTIPMSRYNLDGKVSYSVSEFEHLAVLLCQPKQMFYLQSPHGDVYAMRTEFALYDPNDLK